MRNTVLFVTVIFNLINHYVQAQWVQCWGITGGYSIISSGNNLYAGNNLGLYKSTNSGLNWSLIGLNNKTVESLASSGVDIFAGTLDYGVYVSSNNGSNWIQTSLNSEDVYSLGVDGNFTYAGTYLHGVFLTTNNGLNWIQTSLNNKSVYAFGANATYVFAGADDGLYVSSNNGINWSLTPLNGASINALSINANTIYAAVVNYVYGTGVYLSTNNGINWTQTSLNYGVPTSFSSIGNYVFAGTTVGVFVTSDGGLNWIEKNEGLPFYSSTILSLHDHNEYLLAGIEYNGLWRRPLNEMIGIRRVFEQLPITYFLRQNFPNPFNPSTNIRFDILKTSFVQLTIYNVIGKEVTKLVNKKLKPGSYSVDWDGRNYSSGVYFYSISAGTFNETKRMVLIK